MFKIAAATVAALTALTVITAAPAGAAPTKTVSGKWTVLSSQAGDYRLEVACPAGTRPRSGSVIVQELKWSSLDTPARYRGGSQGVTASGAWYAIVELDKGPKVRARVKAQCR